MKPETKKTSQRIMWIELFPIMFILSVLPLVVRLKFVDIDYSQYAWFPDGALRGDFFAWWRSRIFVVAAVWMLGVLFYRKVVLKYRWKWEKHFGLLGGYLLLTVISTVFSNYKDVSWNGFADNYEGCLMLLLYIFSFFYTTQVLENDREREILFYAFAGGAILQGMIGISQLFGKDFWSSALGNWLAAPGQSLSFQFSGSSENPVYMALYNPNYAAIFIILVIPVCFYLAGKARKKWQKVFLTAEIVLLLLCLWGTGSRAGWSVLGVLAVAGIWMRYCNKNEEHTEEKYFISAVICIVCIICIWGIRNIMNQSPYKLQDIQITEAGIEVVSSKGTFVVNAKEYGKGKSLLLVKDENGEKLPVEISEKSGRYLIKNKKFYGFAFETYEENGMLYIVLYYRKEPFYFVKEGNGEFGYVNLLGKKDRIEKAQSFVSVKFDRLFGSRGYIWNRVLPLLKNYIFTGCGPDTFAFVFPQNDYVGQINAARIVYEEVITKPHSFYIQTALQTGVVSLICMILFFLSYLKKLIKKGTKIENTIALCVTGYLIMGLVNDSMVVTAPVFWVLLGTGWTWND